MTEECCTAFSYFAKIFRSPMILRKTRLINLLSWPKKKKKKKWCITFQNSCYSGQMARNFWDSRFHLCSPPSRLLSRTHVSTLITFFLPFFNLTSSTSYIKRPLARAQLFRSFSLSFDLSLSLYTYFSRSNFSLPLHRAILCTCCGVIMRSSLSFRVFQSFADLAVTISFFPPSVV